MVKHFIISASSPAWSPGRMFIKVLLVWGFKIFQRAHSPQRCQLHLASPWWRSRVDEGPTQSYICTDIVAHLNAINCNYKNTDFVAYFASYLWRCYSETRGLHTASLAATFSSSIMNCAGKAKSYLLFFLLF